MRITGRFSGGPPGPKICWSAISLFNFDRTGFAGGLERRLPARAAEELAADGVIGSVAETHYSFMGASDSAPDGAPCPRACRHLKRDQLIAPSSSARFDRCARAPVCRAGSLSREKRGLATVAISLLRPQTENARPPARAVGSVRVGPAVWPNRVRRHSKGASFSRHWGDSNATTAR